MIDSFVFSQIFEIFSESNGVFDMLHQRTSCYSTLFVEFYHRLLHHNLPILHTSFHDSVEMTDIPFHDDIASCAVVDKYLTCNEIP